MYKSCNSFRNVHSCYQEVTAGFFTRFENKVYTNVDLVLRYAVNQILVVDWL
jgi:hypothetical protein